MTTLKANLSKTYEYVVIGSDINAYVCAHELYKQNKNVVLVPYKDSLEDFTRSPKAFEIHNEPFSYLPANEQNEKLINWLEDEYFLQEGLYEGTKSISAVTFEEGKFKEFLGFGERKLSSLEEVTYYTSSEQLSLTSTPQHWLSALNFEPAFPTAEKATITKFQVENGKVVSVNINGSKELKGDEFIFCGPAKDLTHLLDTETLKGRSRQKLAKSKIWSRINLTLNHSELFDVQAGMHILSGTKDDFEPVTGQFLLSNDADSPLVSHWTYLLDPEEIEDNEITGGIYKYMKRQIKRAYPEAFDKLTSEKVSVHKLTHGKVDSFEEVYSFKGISGLTLLSPEMSDLRGPLAGVDRLLNYFKTITPSEEVQEELEDTEAPSQI